MTPPDTPTTTIAWVDSGETNSNMPVNPRAVAQHASRTNWPSKNARQTKPERAEPNNGKLLNGSVLPGSALAQLSHSTSHTSVESRAENGEERTTKSRTSAGSRAGGKTEEEEEVAVEV